MSTDTKPTPWTLTEWRAHLSLLQPGMFEECHVMADADGDADIRIRFGPDQSDIRRDAVLAGLMGAANERDECVTVKATRWPIWLSRRIRP